MTDILVPTLGESVTEATVGAWMKKPGESVAKDEPVVELETDKVNLEVNAPESGVLAEIVAHEGATVGIGALLAKITAGEAVAPAPAAAVSANGGAQPAPAPAPAPAEAAALVDIVVPPSGESVTEGSIGTWMKSVGDAVAADEAIVEIETDKAAMEIGAPVAGVLNDIIAQPGATVNVGDVIGRIAAGADATVVPAAADPAPAAASGSPTPPVMPAARRVMAENGLHAEQVDGTGRGGRITKADAVRTLEARAEPAPEPTALAPAAPRELAAREERVPMSRLRRTIARRLKEAQNNAAMLTTFNDVDMTAVIDARKRYKELFEKKHGVKLGFMGFFVKAVIQALKDVPAVNAEIDGDDIIYKNYYDIGVAVGTDRGLVVPVVRDADQLTLGGIEQSIADLGVRARDGKLSLDEMQGASFTISNGGVYGSLLSTPILNAPQSGILGMHRIEERPVVRDGQVVAAPMMYLALSYDHRIVDGKEAVSFLVRVKECVEDPDRLMLDL